MNVIERTLAYLMDGASWQEAPGFSMRLLEHLSVTALAAPARRSFVDLDHSGLGTTARSYGTNRRRSNLLMSTVAATRALPRARSAYILALWRGRLDPALPHRAHYYCGGALLAESLAAVPEDLVDAARGTGILTLENPARRQTRCSDSAPPRCRSSQPRPSSPQRVAEPSAVTSLTGSPLRDYPRMLVATLLVALRSPWTRLISIIQRVRGSSSTGRRH